jgi:hypothetical protein
MDCKLIYEQSRWKLPKSFLFQTYRRTKIFIGSYPLHEIDVGKLYETKITAILSLLN